MTYRFLFIILLTFVACKKESDNQKPIIEIISPNENSVYSVLGKIEVSASIQDDGIIQSVSVSVYDFNAKRNVLKPKYFYPNSNTFQLNDNYIISDSLIYSGDYYLTITANDDENQTTAYRLIKIQGIDKKKISALIACTRATSTDIHEVKTGNSPQLIASFDKVCQKLTINNYHQTMWFLPGAGNKLIGYDLLDQRIDFEYNHLTASNSTIFTDMSLNDEKLYVAAKSGHVKGFNPNFGEGFIYQSPGSSFVKRIFESQDLLIVSESNLTNQNETVATIYKVSGSPKSSLVYNKELIGFHEVRPKVAYLIFAKDSTFYFYEYDLDLGFSSQLYSFQGGSFNEVIPINHQEFILIGNKKVVRFNLATKYILDLKANLVNAKAAYDDVNQQVYIASGNELTIVDVQSGATVNTMLFQEEITAIAIRYNR